MRDLDRIREVREYRVTGPQLVSLLGLVALLASAAFLAGYQPGIWRGPLDSELLLPNAEEDTRKAGEALSDLLARRDAPTVESMATPDTSESSTQTGSSGASSTTAAVSPSPTPPSGSSHVSTILKMRNTWGSGWGEDGYFRLAQGATICGIKENQPCYPSGVKLEYS